MEKIGILVLGQTPRPDFERLFSRHLPGVKAVIRGGLDGLSMPEIDELASVGGDYLLFTILRDGSSREISLYRIKPFLDEKIKELAAEGATIAALMCTGDFPDLESPVQVLYPGRILLAVAQGVCRHNRIGLVTPNTGQVQAVTARWEEKGFYPKIAVAAPTNPDALTQAAVELDDRDIELIVLDCMGFPPEEARRMRRLCGRPVLCPQGVLPPIMAQMLGL